MEPTKLEAITADLGQPEAVPAPAAANLEDARLYFNRDLSWLDFNDRVLQLAEDSSVPLLERAKFLAIWESNLDEHFMVRIANLHDQVEGGVDARGADGLSAGAQIEQTREGVLRQRERAARCFDRELRPALAEHDVRILDVDRCTPDEREDLGRLFQKQVFPALTPLVIGLGRPFPYISNLSLSLGVLLRDAESGNEIIARVKVPKELLGRFLPL